MVIKCGDKVKLRKNTVNNDHIISRCDDGELTVRSIFDSGFGGNGYEFEEIAGRYLGKDFEPVIPIDQTELIQWHIKNINDDRVDLRLAHQQIAHFEFIAKQLSLNINQEKRKLCELEYKGYV